MREKLNFYYVITIGKGNGGLVVYTKEAPGHWKFSDFNTNSERPNEKAYSFLESSHFANVTVPYRRNRAVLFTSTLFHNTDTVQFKPGYKNRRINVTFLFGKRGQKVTKKANATPRPG
jgi:hypothetical protein